MVPLVLGIVLLFGIVFSQQAFNLKTLRPDSAQETLVLVALSALVFLLLVVLSFVLVRNLVKLYAERRLGVLGSKFRTRMLLSALALSFAPAILMFMFAYGLMNRSIDRWFSMPVSELQQDSGRVAALLSDYAGDNAHQEAAEIASAPETQHSFDSASYSGVLHVFRRHEQTLQGGFALALLDGDSVATWRAPQTWPILRAALPDLNQLESKPQKWVFHGTEYLIATASVGSKGKILIAMPLPRDFSPTLEQINQNQRNYLTLSRESKRIRGLYMLLLTLLTVLLLFASTWSSLFLAKLVTRPVEALAEATRQISLGHLGHRVEVSAADELGQLVSSFNTMAAELESSRRKIEISAQELTKTNAELDQRRRHIETILESIPTGVLSLGPDGRVTHSNVAFGRMFWQNGGAPSVGQTLKHVFSAEIAGDLDHLLRRADRMGITAAQFEIPAEKQNLNVSVTVSSVQHGRQRLGYVIVFEDFSDLLKAQKEAAWREVARRVAHEIKNPLTPIALSAERIRRHLDRGSQPDKNSLAVINSCAGTISEAVQTVRSLVDEFSVLAKFPEAKPRPADLNEIVESTLAMFNGRLDGIHVEKDLGAGLPQAMADPEAIKRALANLVDNAAEAMKDSLVREIHISTSLLDSRDALEILIADTGHGINSEVKEKLFLPYVSTKKRGTGLGLAIVRRIIEDHHGSVRVEENRPVGAKFIVELPLAGDAVQSETAKTNA
ncbi:MAG TPA: ATP-binding protein [Candidatus Limnocylindrales bacterium]|jgi:nitrogen fixation/metabolism regulation signal transduction histidine kinase|nr:ATP-binding protein [Candidatus Limnocylindrales bacterium]